MCRKKKQSKLLHHFWFFIFWGGFIGQLERIMKAKIWAQGEEFRRKGANQSQGSLASFRWSNLIIETGTLALMMQWLLTLKKFSRVFVPALVCLRHGFFGVFCCAGQKQQLLISIHSPARGLAETKCERRLDCTRRCLLQNTAGPSHSLWVLTTAVQHHLTFPNNNVLRWLWPLLFLLAGTVALLVFVNVFVSWWCVGWELVALLTKMRLCSGWCLLISPWLL